MTMPYKALVATGDKWLDQADDTYRGGGGAQTAAAEAAIAGAYYARAMLEKPAAANPVADMLPMIGKLFGAMRAAQANEPDAAMGRHPAGKKRPTHLREVESDDPS